MLQNTELHVYLHSFDARQKTQQCLYSLRARATLVSDTQTRDVITLGGNPSVIFLVTRM